MDRGTIPKVTRRTQRSFNTVAHLFSHIYHEPIARNNRFGNSPTKLTERGKDKCAVDMVMVTNGEMINYSINGKIFY